MSAVDDLIKFSSKDILFELRITILSLASELLKRHRWEFGQFRRKQLSELKKGAVLTNLCMFTGGIYGAMKLIRTCKSKAMWFHDPNKNTIKLFLINV